MVETKQTGKPEEVGAQEPSGDLMTVRLTPRPRRSTGDDVTVVTIIRALKNRFVEEQTAAPTNVVTRFRVAPKENSEDEQAA